MRLGGVADTPPSRAPPIGGAGQEEHAAPPTTGDDRADARERPTEDGGGIVWTKN